jgi:hypothetical protein
VLTLPGRSPLHLLVELDRGTESSSRLRKKAEDYELCLPYTSLKDLDPLVLLLVPSPRRADTALCAVRGSAAPIAVAVWNKESATSVLATVTDTMHRIGLS